MSDPFASPRHRAISRTPPRLLFPTSGGEGVSLQSIVLAIVLGNLVTVVIGYVVYFNLILFGHYGSELIYAVLLSEALFTTRMSLLTGVKRYTSVRWSPRQWVVGLLTSIRGMALLGGVLAFLVQMFASLDEPVVLMSSALLFFVILDERALFVFRIHHLFVSDEALVSMVLVFFLVACLGVFIGSFLVLALRDAAAAVDAYALYMNENVVKDPLLRSKFNEALLQGKGHIDSIAKSLQDQYQGTPYGPAVQLTTSVLANLTNRFDSSHAEPFSWSFSDWEPLRDEFLSVSMSVLYNGTFSVKDAFRNAADGLYTSFAVLASVLFAFFDFGFRATFFAGVLFFLVSNPKSVLQTVMESFVSVFATARRSNSISSVISDGDLGGSNTEGATAFEAEDRERIQAFRKFEDDLRRTFKAVFAVPVTLAGSNAIASLVIFSFFNLLGANFTASYFAALVALFLTLIPVVSPFLSCLPWCIVASLVHGKHWASFGMLAAHYFAFTMIDSYLLVAFHSEPGLRGNNSFRSYLTGLSFFFGISSMGLHGVVLGPLFVSFFYTTCSTLLIQYREVFRMGRKRSVDESRH